MYRHALYVLNIEYIYYIDIHYTHKYWVHFNHKQMLGKNVSAVVPFNEMNRKKISFCLCAGRIDSVVVLNLYLYMKPNFYMMLYVCVVQTSLIPKYITLSIWLNDHHLNTIFFADILYHVIVYNNIISCTFSHFFLFS